MRALRLLRWNSEPELVDVPEPEPAAGEVVIEVGGAGACHSDLHLMHDFAPGLLPWGPPFTLGHENAGWVSALGAGVTGLSLGQPVAVYGPWGCGRCRRCKLGMENYCERQQQVGAAGGGLGRDGGMSSHMLVPDARWLVPLNDLDPAMAAPLIDAGLTPYHAAQITRPLGHLTIVGIAGGSLPVSFFGIGDEVSVATTYWGSLPELFEVIALAEAGSIRAEVTTYSLDDAAQAYREMRDGHLDGRAVIVPRA